MLFRLFHLQGALLATSILINRVELIWNLLRVVKEDVNSTISTPRELILKGAITTVRAEQLSWGGSELLRKVQNAQVSKPLKIKSS